MGSAQLVALSAERDYIKAAEDEITMIGAGTFG